MLLRWNIQNSLEQPKSMGTRWISRRRSLPFIDEFHMNPCIFFFFSLLLASLFLWVCGVPWYFTVFNVCCSVSAQFYYEYTLILADFEPYLCSYLLPSNDDEAKVALKQRYTFHSPEIIAYCFNCNCQNHCLILSIFCTKTSKLFKFYIILHRENSKSTLVCYGQYGVVGNGLKYEQLI